MGSKKDPAWKYGVEMETDGKKFIRCIFCQKVMRGGVFRMKEHLAGIQGNISACPTAPPEVKEDIKKYMEKADKAKRTNQLVREERIDRCTTLNSRSKEGSNSGSVTQTETQTVRGIRGPMDRFLRGVEDDVLQAEELGGVRTTGFEKELRDRTCEEIGRFFFENGLAFNIADSPSFMNMIRAVGRYGTGLRPPSSHELRTSILKKEEESTKAMVAEVMKTWKQTGVSILSDGWKDIRGRQLINFLVNNPYGTIFLRSIDASDFVKDATLLFKLLDDIVEEVGEDIVVQVVTDNASNYKKAGEMLMLKRKRLWWTPCAAHCVDLILEKLGELPQHKNALRKAKKVSNFIYNHGWVLALFRKFTNKELLRPAPTRFATAYLTLQRMFELKGPLEQMCTSSEWNGCTYAKKPEGKEVKRIILRDPSFWPSISYALKTTTPLVRVLRLADSEKVPGMGFIYGAMDLAKEEIAKNLNDEIGAYHEIWKIIDEKWEFQMHRHLHAAAYFLNPQFQYSENKSTHPEIKFGLIMCMEKLIPDYKEREKADLQLDEFRKREGMFSFELAKTSATKRSPVDWWLQWGDQTPELTSFAVKILSLTCSSSACERNWSSFNMIHTKRRNRLTTKRLNSLVYIMYNRKLHQKFLRHRSSTNDDELNISTDLPSDDEWVMGEDDVEQMSTHYTPNVDMNEPSGSAQVTQQRQKRSRDARKGKRIVSFEDESDRDDIFGQEEEEEDDDIGDDTFHFDPNFRPFATGDPFYDTD